MDSDQNVILKILKTDIKEKKMIAFIGAGVSAEAGLPVSNELKIHLGKEIHLPDSKLDRYDFGLVAVVYEKYIGRKELISKLRELLIKPEIKPSKSHYLIAEFFNIIITTNYDNLMEIALDEIHKGKWYLASNQEQLLSWKKDCPLLLKLHGDLSHPINKEIVITERDYYERKWDTLLVSFLKTFLGSRPTIFMGYSLSDYEINDILGSIFRELGKLSPKMYLVEPNAVGNPHLLTWEDRITGISLEAKEFLDMLEYKPNPIYFRILKSFGDLGYKDGEFKKPRGACLGSEGEIFVVDTGTNRIQKFTNNGEFLLSFGKHGKQFNEIEAPKDICSDSQGNLFVTDCNGEKILQFDEEGRFIKQIEIIDNSGGKYNIRFPYGISCNPNNDLYVTSPYGGSREIIKIESKGSKYRLVWNTCGPNHARLKNPLTVALDEDENVFVVDNGYRDNTDRHGVLKFDKNGEYVSKFGKEGTKPGEFKFPNSIAISGDRVYVADRDHGIQIFDTKGEYVGIFKLKGKNREGKLLSPRGLLFDGRNILWVVDEQCCKIDKLKKC